VKQGHEIYASTAPGRTRRNAVCLVLKIPPVYDGPDGVDRCG
jgi:hypothetical protein